jgi:hypothetical protein
MSKKTLVLFLFLSIVLLLYAITSTSAVGAQELMRALVINLESPHPIEGQVSVVGTVRHATVVRIKDVVVSSARRDDPPQWIDAGSVETDGFTELVLSLQGQIKGSVSQVGTVGVVLVPDEEPFLQALSERVVQLPLEVTAEVTPEAVFFSGSESLLPIAFPSYRVFLYNTSGQGAEVNVYLYLTN